MNNSLPLKVKPNASPGCSINIHKAEKRTESLRFPPEAVFSRSLRVPCHSRPLSLQDPLLHPCTCDRIAAPSSASQPTAEPHIIQQHQWAANQTPPAPDRPTALQPSMLPIGGHDVLTSGAGATDAPRQRLATWIWPFGRAFGWETPGGLPFRFRGEGWGFAAGVTALAVSDQAGGHSHPLNLVLHIAHHYSSPTCP